MDNNNATSHGFFSNDKFMLCSTILAAAASLIQSVMNIKIISYFNAFTFLVNFVCVILLYTSYKHHDKNVTKGLMGAVFMLMLLRNVETVTSYMQNYAQPSVYAVIVGVATSVLVLLLMINHFIINSDRHSKPLNIKISQFLFVILIAVQFLIRMYMIFFANTLFLKMSFLVSIFSVIFTICLLICIESKMDSYKLLREANGWVEKPYSS